MKPKVHHKLLLISILLFAFVTRVWQLGEPNVFYFDEVYHAYTAEAYARNDPAGYEWWHDSPEVIPYCTAPKCAAYEWLHPPLAKLIQAGSIKVLGDQPFAWRYPGVLFGMGTIIILYLLGTKVFNSSRLGLFASFIYSLDGLSFTSSRITMNDTYLAFWVTLALYLMFRNEAPASLRSGYLLPSLRERNPSEAENYSHSPTNLGSWFSAKGDKPLWLVGVVLGLAVSTKWPGVFAIGILGFLYLVREIRVVRGVRDFLRKFTLMFFVFFALPLLVYIVSYGQFWLQGHTLEQFKQLHAQIWWYQTNLKAEHPYSSRPHEWALLIRPLYAYANSVEGKIQNIYLMGNPFIFWGGLAASIYTFIFLILGKLKNIRGKHYFLFGILVAYFGMFMPWLFSPRIMFIYHYVPAIPFLSFLVAWVLSQLWDKNRVVAASYLLLIALSFLYFYPHWTGIAVPEWWDKQYYWLPTWR